MLFLLTPDGDYFEANDNLDGDLEVTQRPGPAYEWTDTGWSLNREKQDVEDQAALEVARASTQARLSSAYATACNQSVIYTTAEGVTAIFQATPASVNNLRSNISGWASGAVPTGFYWISEDNSHVPFAYTDLQGLLSVIQDQAWAAFQVFQSKKDLVRKATTQAQVVSVSW